MNNKIKMTDICIATNENEHKNNDRCIYFNIYINIYIYI